MQQLTLQDISSSEQRKIIATNIKKDSLLDLTIRYESDFRNAKLLREFIDDVCKEFDVSPKWRTRIVLIVDELNNNAIEYGSRVGDNNSLHIKVHKNKDDIVILVAVKDTGKGDHAKTAEEMEALRLEHKKKDFKVHHSIRGRGLFLIISQLVDNLMFDNAPDGGLIVQVEKSLQGSSEK